MRNSVLTVLTTPLADALDGVNYTLKFQFLFQTTYCTYRKLHYQEAAHRGAHARAGFDDGEGDGRQQH